MSVTAIILFNVLLVAAVLAGLAYVCRLPYRLGRDVPAARPSELESGQQAAREQVAA
jgi:hypothetical protein